MQSDPLPIVLMLGSAVAGLFGVLMSLIWFVLKRADARIAQLELREDQTLTAVARNVEAILELIRAVNEAFREVRLLLSERRAGGR